MPYHEADNGQQRYRSSGLHASTSSSLNNSASSSSSAIATSSFFGNGQQPYMDRDSMMVDMNANTNEPMENVTVKGIDLDADDDIPPDNTPPPIELISNSHTTASPSFETAGFPSIRDVFGHGQLLNSLLGKSNSPAFKFGNGFGWSTEPSNELVSHLHDFDLNPDFQAQPVRGAPRLPTGHLSSSTPNPTKSPLQPKTLAGQTARVAPPSYSSIVSPTSEQVPTSTSASALAGTSVNPSSNSSTAVDSPSKFSLPEEYLRLARPHPHAFFNTLSFSWTVITPYPPTPSSMQQLPELPKACPDMSGMYDTSIPNGIHHYVRSRRRIDPRFILRPSEVEPLLPSSSAPVSQFGGPSSSPFPAPLSPNDFSWRLRESPRDSWWDLYVCSRCRRAFTVSPENVITSILGSDLCRRFERARKASTNDGGSEAQRVAMREALDYLWKVLRNILFNGETSAIPSTGATFLKRMGGSSEA